VDTVHLDTGCELRAAGSGPESLDLDAYFERIGYSGSRSPTLETLAALHRRHPQAIPFENLNPLLGRPVPLDPAALERKLVRDRRGGYCYEHNLLFAGVLRALGFRVAGLAARVLWNVAEGTMRPRTHMLLRVEVDGAEYVADVGFGGLTLTGPLRLEPDIEQRTPHEAFRLVRIAQGLAMQAFIHGDWKTLYHFGHEPHVLADYEMANWYVSTHPASLFVTDLIAARTAEGVRHTLRNRELSVHPLNQPSERRLLTSAGELRTALAHTFGVELADLPELDAALARIAARTET
jgi:N-hydroxyarylamine O-acetyltransferase